MPLRKPLTIVLLTLLVVASASAQCKLVYNAIANRMQCGGSGTISTVGSTSIDAVTGITTPGITMPPGTAVELSGACVDPDSIATPTAGSISMFCDSTAANIPKYKSSDGSVSPMGTASVTESGITLADVTTGNVSTTKHGFAPKLPNDATKFLDGTGAYSTPSASGFNPLDTTVAWDRSEMAGAIYGSIAFGTWQFSGNAKHLDGSAAFGAGAIYTGGTTGNAAYARRDEAGTTNATYGIMGNRANWTAIFRVGFVATTDYANSEAFVGFANGSYGTHKIGFRCLAGTDTNWQFATDNGSGSPNLVDTGVACASTSVRKFQIRATAAGSVAYKIDAGTESAAVSTKVPTTIALGPLFYIKTNENAAKTLGVWFYAYQETGLTR